MYYEKTKTKYIFISTVVGCTIDVVLTYILVPHLQIIGSIIADVIAMPVRFVISYFIVKIETKNVYSFIYLEVLAIIPILFMGIALIPSFTKYQNEISIMNLAYKTCVFILYLAVALFVNINQLKKFLRRRLK